MSKFCSIPTIFILLIFNSPCQAEDICPDTSNLHGIMNIIGTGQMMTVATQKYAFEEIVSPCMSAAWEGASDSVKEKVENAPTLLGKAWNTISNTACVLVGVRSMRQYKCVEDFKKGVVTTIDLVRSLSGMLGDAIEGFSEMEPRVQAQLACSMTGQIGLEGVLAYVTLGATRSKFAGSIFNFIMRTKKMRRLLNKSAKGVDLEDQLLMAKNIGNYTDDQVDMIEFFERVGQPKLAKGMLQCSL